MKHLSRDTWLTIGLILVLSLITIAAAVSQTREQEAPSLSSTSNASNGARALRLWLESLGYTVRDSDEVLFSLPEKTRLAWVLEPTEMIALEDWETIDAWVEAGGTLVLAGESWAAATAVEHYDFHLMYDFSAAQELSLQTPLLDTPPITGSIHPGATAYLEASQTDFIVHLASASGPILVSFERGQGHVILSATPHLFSNAGLKEPGNPALVLNLLALQAEPGIVWFDEWHHGVRPSQRQVVGPGDWLRYTPSGRSLLFVAAVIFLALVLQGRAFGKAMPLQQEIIRRSPLEHITALANLSRRAHHRSVVLRQFHQQIKRRLGRRYRINPTLPDEAYVAELRLVRPNLDSTALLNLLKRLQKSDVSENEMIHLAREASVWIQEN